MRRSLPGWLTQATQSLRLRLQTAQEQLATSDYTLHPDEDFSSLQAKAADEPDHVVPWSVRAMASWSWRLIVIGIAMAVLVYALYWMQIVVVPVLVAVLIAVLLDPVNQWQRRVLRFPRPLAATTTVVGMIAGFTALLTFAGQAMVEGFADISESAIDGFGALMDWLSQGPLQIGQEQLQQFQHEIAVKLQANSSSIASGAWSVTSSVGQIISGALIALFCLFFFLMEGRQIWLWVIRLLPVNARERTHEAAIRGWMSLRGYARTQILVAFVDAVGIGVGAWLLDVPLALPLGVLVFMGSFVPIVGALVTGTVAVLVALMAHGMTTAIFMFIVVLAVQQIEGNVLQPFLMGHAVSLHPVAVLLAVAGATYIAGIVGALFIVPMVAFINTFILYLHGRDKFPDLAVQRDRPGGPATKLTEQIEQSYDSSKDIAEPRKTPQPIGAQQPEVSEADPTPTDEPSGEDD